MKTISLKIPETLQRRLLNRAQEQGISKSELLRQALEGYLDQAHSADRESIAALAGDLAGCFAGPEDLSTDRRHLADFGR